MIVLSPVDPPAGGGPDPNLLVRAVGGDFSISFVPNVVHPGMNQGARRTRGIGFVIRLSFEARAKGSIVRGQDVGTPYHQVTVLVPIAIHFEDDGTGQLQVTIDPFDLTGQIGPEMPSHIAVEVRNPLGTPLDNSVGQVIAASALGSMRTSLLAAGGGIASGFLAAFFNSLRPTRRLPANFDVVLVDCCGTEGVPAPVRLSPAPGASGPRLFFLE